MLLGMDLLELSARAAAAVRNEDGPELSLLAYIRLRQHGVLGVRSVFLSEPNDRVAQILEARGFRAIAFGFRGDTKKGIAYLSDLDLEEPKVKPPSGVKVMRIRMRKANHESFVNRLSEFIGERVWLTYISTSLFENVLLETVALPKLSIPPPYAEWSPDSVLLVTVAMPAGFFKYHL